jgi:hypothetical protein
MLEAGRLVLHKEGAEQRGFGDRHHGDGIPAHA